MTPTKRATHLLSAAVRGGKATPGRNPWIRPAEPEPARATTAAPMAPLPVRPGPTGPQAGVPAPDPGNRLPRRPLTPADTEVGLFIVGAHGGAGETTLEKLLPHARATHHAWPITTEAGQRPAPVLLVAGLQAAQRALKEWASATARVDLRGLVLMADAPGKLPRELRELAHLVAGGAPRHWTVAWQPQWRLAPPRPDQLPDDVRAVAQALNVHHKDAG